MGDRSHMTRVQKTIAYSAIVFGILAVLLAFVSSIHVIYYVYTSSAFTTTATATIKGKERQNKWEGGYFFIHFHHLRYLMINL